jgi:hypothetical protein
MYRYKSGLRSALQAEKMIACARPKSVRNVLQVRGRKPCTLKALDCWHDIGLTGVTPRASPKAPYGRTAHVACALPSAKALPRSLR